MIKDMLGNLSSNFQDLIPVDQNEVYRHVRFNNIGHLMFKRKKIIKMMEMMRLVLDVA